MSLWQVSGSRQAPRRQVVGPGGRRPFTPKCSRELATVGVLRGFWMNSRPHAPGRQVCGVMAAPSTPECSRERATLGVSARRTHDWVSMPRKVRRRSAILGHFFISVRDRSCVSDLWLRRKPSFRCGFGRYFLGHFLPACCRLPTPTVFFW